MITPALDPSNNAPLYIQLYSFIKSEIENGNIRFGEKLPSKRTLASHLRISINTVDTAYAQLAAEGYLISKPKVGYYVENLGFNRLVPTETKSESFNIKQPQEKYLYDFKTNAVDTGCFPFSVWSRLCRRVLDEDGRDLLSSVGLKGNFELRSCICRYLHDYRAFSVSPEQVVIGSGSEYLLELTFKLLGRNRLYGLENPGYTKTSMVLSACGAQTTYVPVNDEGIDIIELIKSGADVLYSTPSHHFPLGNVTPVSKRLKLLDWANDINGYIIEDDYDSEFRYSGRPIPALAGLDARGRVIYMNTFAKTLAPSLRIGYIVLPETLLEIFDKQFSFYSSTVPSFEQQILKCFIGEGHFERHLSKAKNNYRNLRDQFLQTISSSSCSEHIKIYGTKAGTHLLLTHDLFFESELIKRAENASIKVYGLSEYYSAESPLPESHTVITGYAGFKPDTLKKAVEALMDAWS